MIMKPSLNRVKNGILSITSRFSPQFYRDFRDSAQLSIFSFITIPFNSLKLSVFMRSLKALVDHINKYCVCTEARRYRDVIHITTNGVTEVENDFFQ